MKTPDEIVQKISWVRRMICEDELNVVEIGSSMYDDIINAVQEGMDEVVKNLQQAPVTAI